MLEAYDLLEQATGMESGHDDARAFLQLARNTLEDVIKSDSGNPIAHNASTTVTFVCRGSDTTAAYLMVDDGGLDNYKMTHDTDPTQRQIRRTRHRATSSECLGDGYSKLVGERQ